MRHVLISLQWLKCALLLHFEIWFRRLRVIVVLVCEDGVCQRVASGLAARYLGTSCSCHERSIRVADTPGRIWTETALLSDVESLVNLQIFLLLTLCRPVSLVGRVWALQQHLHLDDMLGWWLCLERRLILEI